MKRVSIYIPKLPYAVEEAMNRLRINIKFCGDNTRKILVTSSLPNEGKSTISLHLWRLLAEAGFKTTLVDIDLRKSVLASRMRSMDEPTGIEHFLSGQAGIQECIYETNVENGFVIPCIGNIQNPVSLFEEPRFGIMLDKLAEECRYVIIDSPPLYNVADAAQIADMCDGALLVVRAGYTPKKLVRQAMSQIDMTGCRLLGTVLNYVENGKGKYSKQYKYGAYKKYGKYDKKYDHYY